SRSIWKNVDNIPPFVPQAAHGRSGKVTFPAGRVKVPAHIPTGRQTGPAPVYASTPVPADGQNRPTPVHAGRPFPDGRRNSVLVFASWRRSAARPMFRPTSSHFQNSSRPVYDNEMYMGGGRWETAVKTSAGSSQKWLGSPNVTNVAVLLKKIFKYLKGQPKLGLWYPRDSPFVLEAYSDSDFAGANNDRKSTTGGCQFLGRRLISWQCKKQTIVATSSTEAEYVAAANCCGQLIVPAGRIIRPAVSCSCWLTFIPADTTTTTHPTVTTHSTTTTIPTDLNLTNPAGATTHDADADPT
ncbi:hypothetical protein Tco_1059489, partial [Tanacetum coccineum]